MKEEALQILTESEAKRGNRDAQFRRGRDLYFKAICNDGSATVREALIPLTQAAEYGHLGAQLFLWKECCLEQRAIDVEAALTMLTRAADNGCKEAQYHMGDVCASKKDFVKAEQYYKRAAEQDHKDASFKLGVIYGAGVSAEIEKDFGMAVYWYLAAAESDASGRSHPGACDMLAQPHIQAYIERLRRSQAASVAVDQPFLLSIKNEAKRGNVDARFRRGKALYETLWRDGHRHDKEDYNPVMTDLESAANQRHIGARVLECKILHNIYGIISRNPLQIAADQGCIEAQCYVGECFNEGKFGFEKDLGKAAQYYMRAAEQGDGDAAYFLGRIYENGGFGVEKNLDRAVYWYLVAAECGHEDAGNKLGETGIKEHIRKVASPKEATAVAIAAAGSQRPGVSGGAFASGAGEHDLRLELDAIFARFDTHGQWDAASQRRAAEITSTLEQRATAVAAGPQRHSLFGGSQGRSGASMSALPGRRQVGAIEFPGGQSPMAPPAYLGGVVCCVADDALSYVT
ncbi:MAG: sel1 repeat family protein, partial [Gammaproteobacteria bacterium]|nr:sel1 repeat family protein [Gammaproteobacteria bacterium]